MADTTGLSLWSRIPIAFKGGLVVGALGFLISFTDVQLMTTNGVVTSCSYVNYAGYVLAVILVACVVAGFRSNATEHPNSRLSTDRMIVGAVVLILLAAVHVLRGLGTIGGTCPV